MAISPRSAGQEVLTETEKRAKQRDLYEEAMENIPVSQSQPVEGSEVGQDDRILVSFDETVVDTPVETLGVTPEEASTGPSQAVPTEAIPVSFEQEKVPETATEEGPRVPSDYDPEDLVNERDRQLAAERVPSVFDAWGLAEDYNNINEVFGVETADRFRSYFPKKTDPAYINIDPINFPVTMAAEMDYSLQPGTPEFEAKLEELNAKSISKAVEDTGKTEAPLKMLKDNSSLKLTAYNLLTSSKGLNIAKRDPSFNPETIPRKEDGSIDYSGEGFYQTPMEVDNYYTLPIVAAVENFLLAQDVARDRKELETDLEKYDPTRPVSVDLSFKKLGQDAFKTVRRIQSSFKGEPTESYMEDFNNMTPEAWELMGKTLAEYYYRLAPHMVSRGLGQIGVDAEYFLTPEGRLTLEKELYKYQLPDFQKDFLYVKPEKGQYLGEGKLVPTRTGSNPFAKAPMMAEAQVNMSGVPSVIDARRGALYVGLLGSSIATNWVAAGDPSKHNFTHNLTDSGFQRTDKINQISKRQTSKMERIYLEIEEINGKLAVGTPEAYKLEYRKERLEAELKKVDMVRALYTRESEYSQLPYADRKYYDSTHDEYIEGFTGSRKAPEYYSFVNKNLEIGSMLSRYQGRKFYHTFGHQSGTDRAHVIQLNSYQQHHGMRNIIGSGTKYQIKPMSKSTPAERALLRGFGSMFFDAEGLLAEYQVKAALDNISNRSPRYQKYVSIGNKLKNVVEGIDARGILNGFMGLKRTPNGIEGIEGFTNTSFIDAVNQDPELLEFFNNLSVEKDAHKHSIQVADYVMALADYDTAVKTGKPFSSSVNAIEVDGISNGLTTLLTMVGSMNAMYRTGIMRKPGEKRILGMWEDVEGVGEFAGDLRDALGKQLEALLEGNFAGLTISDNTFMKKHKYTEEQIPLVRDMLTKALQAKHKATFRKSPMITLPYGQELKNLINSVYDTIIADPELKQLAEEFGGTTPAAELLNEIREVALVQVLGKELINLTGILKDAVSYSAMFNRAMEGDTPIGGKVAFGGRKYIVTGEGISTPLVKPKGKKGKEATKQELADVRSVLIKQLNEAQENLRAAKASGKKEAVNDAKRIVRALEAKIESIKGRKSVTIKPRKKVLDVAAGRKGRAGGIAVGQILPALAQTVDGGVMAELFSDSVMQELGDPYILPIFDAVITDLGSMEAVEQKINQIFWKQATGGKMLRSFATSLEKNITEGRKEFAKIISERGNSLIDESEHAGVVDVVIDQLETNPFGENKKKAAGYAALLKAQYNPKSGAQINESRNYVNLGIAMDFLESQLYFGFVDKFKKTVEQAISNSKKMEKEVRASESPIRQYSPDDYGYRQ